jgi:murein DD-endopeptidase MepM/ murein hydrolase activator NlpD
MDSVFSGRDGAGKNPTRNPLRQAAKGLGQRVGVLWAARRWSLPGIIAGVVVVGGGIYLAANAHIGGTSTGGAPVGTVSHHTKTTHPSSPSRTHYATAPTATPIAMPIAGNPETGFGWVYSSYLGEWYYNPGVTVAASAGTPVHAAWGGSVAAVMNEPNMGLTVTVDDGNGYATVYGHLGSAAVKAGDTVSQGTVIGTVGQTSMYSRQPGAHLDFGVLHDGQPVNPASLIKGSS